MEFKIHFKHLILELCFCESLHSNQKSYSVVEVDPRSSSANTKSSISDSKDFVVFGVVSVEGQNISSEAS